MTAPNDEGTIREFVHVGLSRSSKGGLIVGFAEILSDGSLAAARWYMLKPALKHKIVGAVYKIRATDDRIWLDSIQYAGRVWHDKTARIGWQIESDVTETRDRIAKLEKKDRTRDIIAEALAPIIKSYQSTDALGKRAIEALVLETLRKKA